MKSNLFFVSWSEEIAVVAIAVLFLTSPSAYSQVGQVPERCLEAISAKSAALRFDAGPFVATIIQVTDSDQGNYSVIRLNILFENKTSNSLALGYHARTSILADELGNTYFGARAGIGPDTSVTGMGTDQDAKVDPQFNLPPHECDSATFQMWGPRGEKHRQKLFHYDVTIDEINPEHPQTVRQHALYFGDFTVTSRNRSTIEGAPGAR